jgi:hypothetical protein
MNYEGFEPGEDKIQNSWFHIEENGEIKKVEN